ncbi:unnamed protein product [marine sediment metagenome]|uniref:Uncharacterized protein n=1 Tax=marine sediment metagenome TaxID=412755 RepID=X1LXH9_9ZZZZ
MDSTPILIVLATLLSLGFTVFMSRRAGQTTRIVLDKLGKQLEQGIEDINVQLEPIINANSRAMGAISSLSDETKMDKALERRIGQDMMGQNEDVLEMIRMAFPKVAEYVDEHPEAITKLLPRLNTLINDPEARKRLSLDGFNTKSDVSRIWREQ